VFLHDAERPVEIEIVKKIFDITPGVRVEHWGVVSGSFGHLAGFRVLPL